MIKSMPTSPARLRSLALSLAALISLALASPARAKPPRPRFKSRLVTGEKPGDLVDIDVDLRGASRFWLVVTDGGNGFGCDWSDWVEPRLVGPAGEKRLTELEWKSARAGWGSTRRGANASGGPLRVGGHSVADGIGTHAPSTIEYEIPEGYDHFRAKAGLDNDGTDQGSCGSGAAVRFLVYTEKPPLAVMSGGEAAGHEPEDAVDSLQPYEGLEATLFASEPELLSPSDIDVDSRGRVWVCEVVNYRGHAGTRKEGDRILIFEDRDGDGVSDRRKVYYQGRDVDSAMGICVLGSEVIISCSPNIIVFRDEDGDDRPDQKRYLFTKTGPAQHDHSAHTFTFGPDGRLYWNFGNVSRSVHDAEGRPVVDLEGRPVVDDGHPFFGGMAFRCEVDGSRFEVLAHNFRNPYEVTVDSFGGVWQSDNDDDGNRSVRIVEVIEHGNYGYRDEMTGAGWSARRTGMSSEVPRRHWHQNDPGVIPNLLTTGSGSPSGIAVYEGRLLPEVFRGQLVHAEAGHNVVRAYPVKERGAGFEARIVDILDGRADRWFRPVDVCVAPDGSLFVADWYDPGVGGHGMRDLGRGRIFRVAPKGAPYRVTPPDVSAAPGAIEALRSPCLATRYLGYEALRKGGARAETALASLWRSASDPRRRARALWLLGLLPERGMRWVLEASRDGNPDLRITAIRVARRAGLELGDLLARLARDRSARVRRAVAIALRSLPLRRAAPLWAELAARHDGRDRTYLEALGIAADPHPAECLGAWLERVGDGWNTPAGRDIAWRVRAPRSADLLAKIIETPSVDLEELPRFLRAFDFLAGAEKEAALIELARGAGAEDSERGRLIALEVLRRLGPFDRAAHPKRAEVLDRLLARMERSEDFVDFVDRFSARERYGDLVAVAREHAGDSLGVRAARVLLGRGGEPLLERALLAKAAAPAEEIEAARRVAEVLGKAQDRRAVPLLVAVLADDERAEELRREATSSLTKTPDGAKRLLALARDDELPALAVGIASLELGAARWGDVREEAARLLPLPRSKEDRPSPPIRDLMRRRGDRSRGGEIYRTTGTCASCHVVAGEGKAVGPDLSEIGSKLSRESLYESILFPSAGILHSYETRTFVLRSGDVVTGILSSETAEGVSVKTSEAIVREVAAGEIAQRVLEPTSLMPADLYRSLSEQDLADLVEYLAALKGKVASGTGG